MSQSRCERSDGSALAALKEKVAALPEHEMPLDDGFVTYQMIKKDKVMQIIDAALEAHPDPDTLALLKARKTQWEDTKKKWTKKRFQEWQRGHIEGHLEELDWVLDALQKAIPSKSGTKESSSE